MAELVSADVDDIDYELYDETEATFEEIIRLVAEAREEKRVPGEGPDRPDDLVAILVSSEYKKRLELPFYRRGPPLSDSEDLLEVPLVRFAPLEGDYPPLIREDAEGLFDQLAEDGLAREELRIAEHVLAEFGTLDAPAPHLPEVVMVAVQQAFPGERDDDRWPAA